MGAIVPDAIEHYLASLNRAADPLLQEIAALFLAVADFSELGAAPAAAHKEA